jgi:hypothetical protein
MTFVVVYDSTVLHGAVGELLLRLAARPTVDAPTFGGAAFHATWTQLIVDEYFEDLVRRRPDLDREALRQRSRWVCAGVDMVSGHEPLIAGIELPKAERRHVLAAAIRCGAQAIVTFTPEDFPDGVLHTYQGLEALHPDVFVVNQLDHDSSTVWSVCQEQAAASPGGRTVSGLISLLEAEGLMRCAARLRQFRPPRSPRPRR